MAGADELFGVKNNFWLGNFQMALNEAASTHLPGEEQKLQRSFYAHRASIAAGDAQSVLAELSGSESNPGLQAVRELAQFAISGDGDMAAASLLELAGGSWEGADAQVSLIAHAVLCSLGNVEDALRALSSHSGMEHRAARVDALLRLHRADLAETTAKEMRKEDDESTLATLANAWVATYNGGPTAGEAALSVRELADRSGATPLLLNTIAAAFMAAGSFDEAEAALNDAAGRSADDPTTLRNLVTCASHQGKPQTLLDRYLSKLDAVTAGTPAAEEKAMLESQFDRVAQTLQ